MIEPKKIRETFVIPLHEEYMKAMEDDMGCISENGVWTLVDITRGCRAIEAKCVLKNEAQ